MLPTWMIIVIALFILIYGLFTVRTFALEISTEQCLKRGGRTTTADIAELSTRSGGKAQVYYVTYSFYIKGDNGYAEFEHKQQISWRYFGRLKEHLDDPLQIVYLQDKPEISRLAASDIIYIYSSYFGIFFMVFFPPLILWWIIVYSWNRRNLCPELLSARD